MFSTRDVIIRSDDYAAAKQFYQDLLGFELTQETPMLGFDTGSFTLYVERGAKSEPVFEYAVDDVQQAKARLMAAGCELVEENAAIPRCYLRDPFGLVFNLTPR